MGAVRTSHHSSNKEIFVPTKTCAIGGLLLAAAGALATGSPASAQVPTWGGGRSCCSSHSSSHNFSRHHSRNWNGSENSSPTRVRLHLNNRNNNIAVARPGGDSLGLGLLELESGAPEVGIPDLAGDGDDGEGGGGGNDGGGGGGGNN
jgi:hypothetical protein